MKMLNKSKTELLVTIAVILLSMLLFAIVSHKGIFQEVVISVTFLFLLPYFYIKNVLKESLINFGFRMPKKDNRKGDLFIFFASILIVSSIFYLLNDKFDFSDKYFITKTILKKHFLYFILYELVWVNFFVLLYEFFFRGFIMFYFSSFSKKVGGYAIFIQFLFFILFLDLANQLNASFLYYIIIAPFAGLIAYRTESLLYSYFFSIISIVIGDIIALKITN